MQNIDRSTPFTADSSSAILVIGVNPDYRIGIKKGAATPTEWDNSEMRVFDVNSKPEGGYVVASVSPTQEGEAFAVTQVLIEGFGGPAFRPCDGRRAFTFQATPGEVLYLGDFDYSFKQGQLQVGIRQNVDKAQVYMTKNYPQVRPSLTSGELVEREVKGLPCNATIPVPITIHR